MIKLFIPAVLLTFFTLNAWATGIAEEQLLGGTQENVLEGLIKTIDDFDEYEEVLKKIEEEQENSQIEEPVPPIEPEEPKVEGSTVEKPAVTQPSVSEPVDTKPAAVAPAVSEPADTKPAAVAPAVSEPAAAEPKTSKPTVQIHTRNILARRGDSIEISLKGKGWIYIGEQQGRVGIEFRGRDSGFDTTGFSMYAADLGEYVLQFQLQDLAEGILYIEEINTQVLSDEDFEQALTGAKEGVELTHTGSGDYTSARRMVNNGRLDDGLAEFLRQYKEGEPAVNQEIASLAYNVNRFDIARRYWGNNLEDDSPFRDEAVAGVIKTAVALGNQQDYDAYIGEFLKIHHPEKGEILIAASAFQEELGNIQEAVNLLLSSLDIEPYGLYADQACFRLGKIYESQTELKDIQKAVDYYTRVKDDFPGSLYWEESRSRIDYLNRHFLQIR